MEFDAARAASIPRTYIDCIAPAMTLLDVMRRRVRTDPGWMVMELKTGHDAMVTRPEQLARGLAGAIGRAKAPSSADRWLT